MYNRYIPQPDGSYRRNRIPDPCRPAPPRPEQRREPVSEPIKEAPAPPPKQEHREPERKAPEGIHAGNFLRQLLPKDFDTSDLIVVLLLLLMAGDCQEDQNTALLTLALYLFL